MRESDSYHKSVIDPGRKRYRRIVDDFGDVRSLSFEEWWKQKWFLFTLDDDFEIAFLFDTAQPGDKRYFVRSVPVIGSEAKMVQYFREEVRDAIDAGLIDFKRSRRRMIEYQPAQRPVLSSLHEHLEVWKAKKEYPDRPDHELFDLAKLSFKKPKTAELVSEYLDAYEAEQRQGSSGDYYLRKVNRKKQGVVQRHLRIAHQYIKNVARGEFPKRDGR